MTPLAFANTGGQSDRLPNKNARAWRIGQSFGSSKQCPSKNSLFGSGASISHNGRVCGRFQHFQISKRRRDGRNEFRPIRPAQPGEIFCAPRFSLRSLRSKRQNRPSPLCHFDQRGQEKSPALQVSRCARSARNDRVGPIHFVIPTSAARRNLLRPRFLAALAPLETTEPALSTLSFRPARPGEIFCAPGFSLRSKRQNRPYPLCHFDRRSQEKSSALHVSRCARSARNDRIGPLHFVIPTSAARRNLLRPRFLAALAPLETTESALSTLSSDQRSQEKSSAPQVSRCARSARNDKTGPVHEGGCAWLKIRDGGDKPPSLRCRKLTEQ